MIDWNGDEGIGGIEDLYLNKQSIWWLYLLRWGTQERNKLGRGELENRSSIIDIKFAVLLRFHLMLTSSADKVAPVCSERDTIGLFGSNSGPRPQSPPQVAHPQCSLKSPPSCLSSDFCAPLYRALEATPCN